MKKKSYNRIVKEFSWHDSFIRNYKKTLNITLGGDIIWCYTPLYFFEGKVDIDFIKKRFKDKTGYNILNKNKKDYNECLKITNKTLEHCIKKNEVSKFKCGILKKGVCIPIFNNNNEVYSAVIICNISVDLNKSILSLLNVFGKLISVLILREDELCNIKKVLHPRAVALSTIHTVHRIIGSTLELEELLPKIARLCLQVIRADRCTIGLIDKESKYLVPHITVDLKNPDAKSKKIKIGSGNIGKVMQTAQGYKSNNCICIPLMNENVIGAIIIHYKQSNEGFDAYDEEILAVLSEQASVAICNAQLYEDQKKIIIESVKSLSALLNVQIPSSYVHNIGFMDMVEAIGYKTELNQSEMNALRYAVMLRNVAKVGIPGEILLKPDGLTASEYSLIKKRSREMIELIRPLEVLSPAIPILKHHREKYDGTGYPSKLKKENIPLGSRIMAVVEAFEVMITSRPYKGPMSISDAVKEIDKNKGTQFDPHIVGIFLELVKDGTIQKILKSHRVKNT